MAASERVVVRQPYTGSAAAIHRSVCMGGERGDGELCGRQTGGVILKPVGGADVGAPLNAYGMHDRRMGSAALRRPAV